MPTAQIEITSRGERQVARGFRNIDRSVGEVGRTSERVTGNMRAGWSKVGAAVKGMGAILGGAAIAAGGKKVLEFKSRLGQLQADMGITTKSAEAMGASILKLSSDFGANKDEIVSGVEVFQAYGGMVKKAEPIMGALVKRHKATGASMAELSTIAATLMSTLNMSPEGAIRAIDKMIAQSIAGQVSMQKMAKVLPDILSGGVGKGFTGDRAISQLGTLLQVAGQASGGKAEEARTKAKALLRDLKANAKVLKKMGISVLDKDKNLKDIDVIMAAILKKTKGTMMTAKGKELFTADSSDVAGIYKSMFDQALGQFREGSTQLNVAGAKGGGSAVDKMYNDRIHGVAKEAEAVGKAMRELEATLMTSGGNLIKWVNENRGKAAAVAVAGVAAVKLGPSIMKGLFGLMKKGGKGGGVAGTLGGAMGVQPVFVVNMPGANIGQAAGFFGEGGGALGGQAGGATGKVSKLGKVMAAAGKGSLVLGAAFAGYAFGTWADGALGLSNRLSDLFAGGSAKERAAKARQANIASGTTAAQRRRQSMSSALSLARIAGQGRSSVGVRGADGKMQQLQLTQGAVMKYLEAQAKGGGMKQENWELVAGQLAKAIKGMPIEVKPADGLDKVSAQKGRGGKQ